MSITIVGAGPVGCYLGQLLKSYGFSPLILEEHPKIGVPAHCAGLVGSSFFRDSKIPLPEDVIINRLNGAIIYYKEQSFVLKRKNAAFVIDRIKLDEKLSRGLNIRKNTKVLALEEKNGKYLLHTNKGSFYSEIVIGADGATSTIRKLAGFKLRPIYYRGALAKVKIKAHPNDMVRIEFSRPFLYFSWLIPENEETCRLGSISENPRKTLNLFLENLNPRGEILEFGGGVLSIGYGQTLKDNIALVGDAACQVKPLSGGGLYYGMRCAEILADCIKEGNLSLYEKRWKKFLGKEIQSALRIRTVSYTHLTLPTN